MAQLIRFDFNRVRPSVSTPVTHQPLEAQSRAPWVLYLSARGKSGEGNRPQMTQSKDNTASPSKAVLFKLLSQDYVLSVVSAVKAEGIGPGVYIKASFASNLHRDSLFIHTYPHQIDHSICVLPLYPPPPSPWAPWQARLRKVSTQPLPLSSRQDLR